MNRLPARRRWVGEGTPGSYQEYDQTTIIEIGGAAWKHDKKKGGSPSLRHGLPKNEQNVGHNSSSRSKRGHVPALDPHRRKFLSRGIAFESGKINTTTPIVKLNLQNAGCFWGNGKWRRIGWIGNVEDQRQNSGRWAVRKVAMVIAEGKADERCERIKPSWSYGRKQMSKRARWDGLVSGYPLLGVGKSVVWVTIRRHEMCDRVGMRRPPQTVNKQKQKERKKMGGIKERKKTHDSSSVSSSMITKSIWSGRWCELQYPKYPEFVRRRAPFVSSVVGWGKAVFHHWKKQDGSHVGDIGSSPAPWHADTGRVICMLSLGCVERGKEKGIPEPTEQRWHLIPHPMHPRATVQLHPTLQKCNGTNYGTHLISWTKVKWVGNDWFAWIEVALGI